MRKTHVITAMTLVGLVLAVASAAPASAVADAAAPVPGDGPVVAEVDATDAPADAPEATGTSPSATGGSWETPFGIEVPPRAVIGERLTVGVGVAYAGSVVDVAFGVRNDTWSGLVGGPQDVVVAGDGTIVVALPDEPSAVEIRSVWVGPDGSPFASVDQILGWGWIEVTAPEAPTAPVPPAETALVDAARGGISVPAQAVAGATVSVGLGAERAGRAVTGWLFSTPVSLGTTTTDAAGSAIFGIPADVPAGVHRLAVTDESGALLGWGEVEVTVTAGAPSDPTPAPTAAAPIALAATGPVDGVVLPLLAAAGALLVSGAVVRTIRRRA